MSIRTITSGEILTYLRTGVWQPQAAIFSSDIWGRMAEAAGIKTDLIESRIAGNTDNVVTQLHNLFNTQL